MQTHKVDLQVFFLPLNKYIFHILFHILSTSQLVCSMSLASYGGSDPGYGGGIAGQLVPNQ